MSLTKTEFYIGNCTWGILMNIFGAVAALVLLCTGHKPSRHGGCFCFEVDWPFGGVNLGLVMICHKGASEKMKNHELGHAIQNVFLGPLTPFVIFLPSFVRCSYYVFMQKYRPDKYRKLPAYDSFWVERDATEFGNRYINLWR